MADQTFCKIEAAFRLKDRSVLNNKEYFVEGAFAADSFAVHLTDGKAVWRGAASAAHVREAMWPHGGQEGFMSTANFVKMVRESLEPPTAGHKRFQYIVEPKPDNALELEWRFAIDPDSADTDWTTAKLLFHMLPDKEHKAHIQRLLSWLMEREAASNKKVNDQKQAFDDMQEALSLLQQQTARTSMEEKEKEAELYQKFCLVLDRKKRKIAELQTTIEELEAQLVHVKAEGGSLNSQDGSPKRKRVVHKRINDDDDNGKDLVGHKNDQDVDDDDDDDAKKKLIQAFGEGRFHVSSKRIGQCFAYNFGQDAQADSPQGGTNPARRTGRGTCQADDENPV